MSEIQVNTTSEMTSFDDVCRVAYGNSKYSKDQVEYAKSLIILMAKHPIEIVEAYYLVHRDKYLSEALFELIKTTITDEGNWKVISDWTRKMGLGDLKEKIFEQKL